MFVQRHVSADVLVLPGGGCGVTVREVRLGQIKLQILTFSKANGFKILVKIRAIAMTGIWKVDIVVLTFWWVMSRTSWFEGLLFNRATEMK